MIILGVVVLYIRLSQEWPAAKVKPTGEQTILDWNFFTSLSANFYCDCSNILFFDSDIQWWVEYPMTCLLKTTSYKEKAHYWYQTITHWR